MKPWVFSILSDAGGMGASGRWSIRAGGRPLWAEGAAAAAGRAAVPWPSIRPYYSVPWDDCQRRKGANLHEICPSGWGFLGRRALGRSWGDFTTSWESGIITCLAQTTSKKGTCCVSMEKPVIISIRGVQTLEEGQEDVMELVTQGILRQEEGGALPDLPGERAHRPGGHHYHFSHHPGADHPSPRGDFEL